MKRSSRTAAAVARAVMSNGNKESAEEPKPKIKKTSKSPGPAPSKKGPSPAAPSRNLKIKASKAPKSKNPDESNTAVEISPFFAKNSNPLALPREFYEQDCLALSQALLGTVLCRRMPDTGEILRGTIVETEAYPGNDDMASQSYLGKRTPRNEAMFMTPGTAYVYFTYGMYFCFNISSRGEGSAVLLRAAEPLEDYETMHTNRAPRKKKGASDEDHEASSNNRKRLQTYELANGPSKLCISFGISRDSCDKIDMAVSSDLWLERSKDLRFLERKFEITADKRIGIESTPPAARNKLWRFFVKDSLAESRAKVGEIKKKLKASQSQ